MRARRCLLTSARHVPCRRVHATWRTVYRLERGVSGGRVQPATTECRASRDLRPGESCTGSSAACPADAFQPATTECRASAGICDQAKRTARGSPPPVHSTSISLQPRSVVPRPECATRRRTARDWGAACPVDAFKPAITMPRSAGVCDQAESCNRIERRLSERHLPAPNHGSAAPRPGCVRHGPESCTGCSRGLSGDASRPPLPECRPRPECADQAESCTDRAPPVATDRFQPALRSAVLGRDLRRTGRELARGSPPPVHRPAISLHTTEVVVLRLEWCDQAENCTGLGAACPGDAFKPASMECRGSAGDLLDPGRPRAARDRARPGPARCFKPATRVARASVGICDQAESCTDRVRCPGVLQGRHYECARLGGVWRSQAESCTGFGSATCRRTPSSPQLRSACSAGICDQAETARGSRRLSTSDLYQPPTSGVSCFGRSVRLAENCTGLGAPVRSMLQAATSGVQARPECATGAGESCTGSSAACRRCLQAAARSAGAPDLRPGGKLHRIECGLSGLMLQARPIECRASAECATRPKLHGSVRPEPMPSRPHSECRAFGRICDQAESLHGSSGGLFRSMPSGRHYRVPRLGRSVDQRELHWIQRRLPGRPIKPARS